MHFRFASHPGAHCRGYTDQSAPLGNIAQSHVCIFHLSHKLFDERGWELSIGGKKGNELTPSIRATGSYRLLLILGSLHDGLPERYRTAWQANPR